MLDNMVMDYRKLYKCFSESQIDSMYNKIQKLSAQSKKNSVEELSRDKVALPTTIDAVRARRIERALKCKMKLLHQSGPNCFIVQTESGRKYRVMIGLQSCNCNRGYFCSHLLFVMLRVLTVSSRDSMLWSRNLKNFEVEQLIKSYEEKSSDPKKQLVVSQRHSEHKGLGEGQDGGGASGSAATSEGSGDEESCPICLQNMEIGEKLVICRGGCNNKLHHECMKTWAQEQEKRKERLMCPLCRFLWHDIDSFEYTGHGAPFINVNSDVVQGPYQDPWLQPLVSVSNTELAKEKRPILPQHRSLSRSWVQMFGSEFVKGLFSKDWTIRETSLRWLGQLVISLLQERRASVDLNGQSVKITTLQECMATLLSYMIMDPVHKVYMIALAATQAVTIFSAPETKSYLSFIFQPVFEAIFIRCTDPTRRTYLNSSDFLVYLCRYDENGSRFGGVDYLFSFSLNTHNSPDEWRWWLGRLRVLLRLLTERPLYFTLPEKRDPQVKDKAPRLSAYGDMIHLDSTCMHKRLFKIMDFAIQGMSISHFSVRKTGSRVLRESIRRASKDPDALMEIKTLLTSLGRNSNPMLTIYASVLREEALKKQKTRPEDQHQYAQMMIPRQQHDRNLGYQNNNNIGYHDNNTGYRDNNAGYHDNNTGYRDSNTGYRDSNTGYRDNNTGYRDNTRNHPISYRDSMATQRSNYFESKPPSIEINSDTDTAHEHSDSFSSQGSSHFSRSSSTFSSPYASSYVTDQSPSTSRYSTPSNTPRTLIIESEIFKFDNIPHTSSSPCSNVATPETAKRVESPNRINSTKVLRSSSQLIERAKAPDSGVMRSSSQLIETSNRDQFNHREFGGEGSSGKPARRTSFGGDAHVLRRDRDDPTGRGKRKMRAPRPQSLPTLESLFQDGPPNSLCTAPHNNNSPSPSEAGTSSASSSNSGKKSLRADEEYELAIARAKHLSLGQAPLPDIPAFQNSDNLILYSPSGTNGSYVENVHWKRGQQIGIGGCSTCYCAWDLSQGQLMCVKQVSFIRNTESEQNEVIENIREEVSMMRQIAHRNIVRLVGAIQLDAHFNIFVEWMPGGSISTLLDSYGPFDEKVLLNYTQQIILAVDYLHTNRFLHRDIKGANCLVDSTGRHVKIGDFGTAAKLHASITPAGQFRGELLGTVAFMAPEVLRGEDYGRHCDIWSVGCCMLEMAEGKPPWNARALTNHLALIYKIASASMSPPIPEHLSPATKDMIRRCLHSDPKNRASASELLTHAVFTRLPHLNLDS